MKKLKARDNLARWLLRDAHVAARSGLRLIPIVRKVDIVYGPLVDAQEFPEDVDVTLVEGAVSTQEDGECTRYGRAPSCSSRSATAR